MASTTLLPQFAPPTAETAYAQPREILTAAGEQSHVTLSDGSKIIVAPQSHVTIGPWDGERRITLVQGEAHFEVTHAALRFVVYADSASVTAIGTAFMVERDGRYVRTVLERGRVRVMPDDRPANGVFVDLGHAVTIKAGRVIGSEIIDAKSEASWTRGELVFANTPLVDAVARYNRYTARPIRIAGGNIGKTPITGRFRIGGKSGFVDMIAAAGIVRVIRNSADGVVITEARK